MPAVVTANINKDSYVDQTTPGTNYGTSADLSISDRQDAARRTRSFLQADLSSIPSSASILSATLNVYAYASSEVVMTAILCDRVTASWSESNVDYSNQPSFDTTDEASQSNLTVPAWKSFDITEIVKDWVSGALTNNGLVLRCNNEGDSHNSNNSMTFRSSNYSDADFRPYITVNHSIIDLTFNENFSLTDNLINEYLTPYTKVAKPTGSAYTKVNAHLPSYDEPSTNFDSSSVYYDGLDTAAYTQISKPTSSVYTKVAKNTWPE